jgi:hypothetical protein
MEIEFYTFLKIDKTEDTVSDENFENLDNIQNYIEELIDSCINNEGDREYIFEPTLETTKNHIENIIKNDDREEKCRSLAERLLAVEKEANDTIKHLGKEIPKGILMIALVKDTEIDNYKFVIAKADYSEFLEESTGDKRRGLPTKKKIFKSFIMNYFYGEETLDVQKILTYDANVSRALYWWKTFLELKEVRDNEKNTTTAYNSIRKEINKLQRRHKQDYLCLRNATIAYFKSEGQFDINYYKDVVIGGYQPYDTSLDMNDLKNKIQRLPQKHKFDNVFEKTPSVIRDKFKDIIRLTSEIDLNLKQEILNIERVIQPHKDDQGNEYIMIQSSNGYKYAEGLKRD